MRANVNLFWVLSVFFVIAAALYTVWTILATGSPEWVGVVALSLCAILGGLVGYYLSRVLSAQGGTLPEDRIDANIDDGDAELGFFSPWSWWPITLAAGIALVFLGIAVGFWVAFFAVPLVLVALVGWVFEYYRGHFAR